MAGGGENNLPKGYMGKILRVDLTTRQQHAELLDKNMAHLFFGGRGFGAFFLFQHFQNLKLQGKFRNPYSEVDPLSENNVIIISTSPCTGTGVPTSGRVHMNFKSPLTGIYGSTNAGGKWAVEFKRTGYDALIITGKAEKPTYLLVTGEEVKFCDAQEIVSQDSVDKRLFLQKKYGSKLQVLSIGKGGQNFVRFASVMSDTGKAFGRTGAGAVWASKNLYAVAALSESRSEIEVADTESFDSKNERSAMYHARLKLDLGKFTRKEAAYGILSSMGSLGIMGMINSYRQLLRNNMKDTAHKPQDIEKIDGEALRNHAKNAKPGEKKILVKKGSCFNCPVACKRDTELLDENGNLIEKSEGPEFENTAMLGANLSIYDLPTIVQANSLVNRYGIDAITTGATIAAFIELYQFIKCKKDTLNPAEKMFLDDVKDFVDKYGEPQFGQAELLIPIIRLIGKKEGIGKSKEIDLFSL